MKLTLNAAIDDLEQFRALRLIRGVYGQRQDGVNMIRIKFPSGKLGLDQLNRISDISDKYGSSNLHLTTRQDIQLHYIKLSNAPPLLANLEEKGINFGKLVLKRKCKRLISTNPQEKLPAYI